VRARAHVVVSGDVQGVFFRQETKRQAEAHGVSGWVRNRDDGSVEAVFEGEKQDVKALVEFCKHGPSGAMVTNVDVKWENFTGEFNDFKILYA
jgi:acylphosphatase